MKNEYKGITSYEKLNKSPFINELFDVQVSARRRILAGKDGDRIVSSDGTVTGNQVFAIQEKVDKETFTKMFSGMMKELFKLSNRGIKVFGYITTIAKPNKDVILFDMEECLEYTTYKKEQSILHGLEELLQHGIIARTKKHYKYYINPNLFFNGNRLTLIRQYQKDERLKPNSSNSQHTFIDTKHIPKLPPDGESDPSLFE